MIPVETRIITPRKFPLLIILAVLILLVNWVAGKSMLHDVKYYLISGMSVIFGALYLLLVYTYIVIDNESIILKLPFRKIKSFLWKDICEVNWEWSVDGHTANLSWVIYYNTKTNINFQPSYYKRSDLQKIAEALILKCPYATIHKKIKNAAEGKFPWYLF